MRLHVVGNEAKQGGGDSTSTRRAGTGSYVTPGAGGKSGHKRNLSADHRGDAMGREGATSPLNVIRDSLRSSMQGLSPMISPSMKAEGDVQSEIDDIAFDGLDAGEDDEPQTPETPSTSAECSAMALFNTNPKKGVKMMVDLDMVKEAPDSIAAFLHECDGLEKVRVVGVLISFDCISSLCVY